VNDRRSLTLGVVIALVGGFFLLRRSVEVAGPAPILLLLGAIFLALSALRSFRGPLLPAGVLLGLGAGFQLQSPLEPWLPRWAALLAGLGAGFLLSAGLDQAAGRDSRGRWLAPAVILIGIAAVAGLARRLNPAAFFDRLSFLWPWLLVAAGTWLVVTALRRRKT
jgi:hypothetical protein